MTSEERHDRLDLCWRGVRCVVCQFPFDQREGIEEIVETKFGYAHSRCAEDVQENEIK